MDVDAAETQPDEELEEDTERLGQHGHTNQALDKDGNTKLVT